MQNVWVKLFKAEYFERRKCLKSTQLKQNQKKLNSKPYRIENLHSKKCPKVWLDSLATSDDFISLESETFVAFLKSFLKLKPYFRKTCKSKKLLDFPSKISFATKNLKKRNLKLYEPLYDSLL